MKKLKVYFLITIFFLSSTSIVFSAPTKPPVAIPSPVQLGCGEGFGPFASLLCQGTANTSGFVGRIVNTFFSNLLGLLTAIAGLYFFFQIVTAGIAWVGAGGDKASVEAARSKIFNAVIGLVVVAAAWVLVGIIGQFIGFNILDTGSMIDKLRL